MSVTNGWTESTRTNSFIPVLWGFRGMNIRTGPARFPLWGTMDSFPAAAHPHTHSWDQWALIASKRSALLQLVDGYLCPGRATAVGVPVDTIVLLAAKKGGKSLVVTQ